MSRTIKVHLFAACASFRLLCGINVKFAVALLALASFAGALRGQTLAVNKYACTASSFTTTLPNPNPNPSDPNAKDVFNQCTAASQANVGDPVVFFVTIVNQSSPSGPITLTDTLPPNFVVTQILCGTFVGFTPSSPPPTSCSASVSYSVPILTVPGLG